MNLPNSKRDTNCVLLLVFLDQKEYCSKLNKKKGEKLNEEKR